MYFAIFLGGILSGAFALGIGWWGEPSLLILRSDIPSYLSALLIIAIHVISITSIVGGTLIFVSAPASRFALLSSAVAWLGLIAIMGHGMSPAMALLILVTAASGLGGFLAAVRDPWLTVREDVAPFGWLDPTRLERRSDEPRPPKRRERAERVEAAPAPAATRREPIFNLGEVEETWTPQRSDGQPVPTLRRPKRGRAERSSARLVAGAIGLGVVVLVGVAVFTLGGDLLSRPARQIATDLSASSSAQLTATAAAAPSARDERLPRGSVDLSPAAGPASSAEASPDDLGDVADDPAQASSSSAIAGLPSVDATAIMASNVAANVATGGATAAPSSAPPSALPTSFSSPDDYCHAIGTSDAPDASKITDGLATLTTRARTQAAQPQGEVRWRCMDAAVWVCVQPAGGLSCDKVPSSVDRVLICASHPDAKGIRTAAGDWSCDGFTPVVSQAQLNAPDRRGFDKAVWKRLDVASASTQ